MVQSQKTEFGSRVGELVGLLDGWYDGCDGEELGNDDGEDGKKDGDLDGANVGGLVGGDEGFSDGDVGLMDFSGDSVGVGVCGLEDRLGTAETGFEEGCKVGRMDGFSVIWTGGWDDRTGLAVGTVGN